jgi:thiamine-phosphate pyrophosphorylase
MKVILISYPGDVENEMQLITALFDNGLERFHIRKPGFDYQMMKKVIIDIPRVHHDKLIVHSHFDLLKEFELKGIHFTDRNKSLIKDYDKVDVQKSVSTHTIEELKCFLNTEMDYAFISPVFNSISKNNYQSTLSLDEMQVFLSENNCTTSVIALGGVELNNIGVIKQTGFDGFALLGAIWEQYQQNGSIDNVCNYFTDILDKANEK